MTKKSPNPVDKHVGTRIRMRRLMLDMSQTHLGNALGLTFQQVQKYEKGSNRVGASRLQHIAGVLQVPVKFFFEGAPDNGTKTANQADAHALEDIAAFLSSRDGLVLAQAFNRIHNRKLRQELVALIEQLTEFGI